MSGLEKLTWPAKYAGETVTAEFDFSADMAHGDALGSVGMVASTVDGVDAAPAALLLGLPVVRGLRVYQRLTGGTVGCAYRIACEAATTAGNVLVLARVLPVVAL